jgi:ubiquinone/menaquinone biosynthesis C-methylase UbiE
LRCPRCGARGLTINAIPQSDDLLPKHGEAICDPCGAHYPITDHILDLAQRGDGGRLTFAGWSNRFPGLPYGYEHVWRPRSLSLLTGEPFSIERELKLVNAWLRIMPRELVVDLGSSTDLYARGIAKSTCQWGGAAPTIIAVDMALGMLKAGRAYARQARLFEIIHVRAPVERLPFADGTVDALMCGGSLNEFHSMRVALREARRVCSSKGRLLTMSLIAANSPLGKLGQWLARTSGIRFPQLDEFNATIKAAGWACLQQQVFGAVVFTLLKPSGS